MAYNMMGDILMIKYALSYATLPLGLSYLASRVILVIPAMESARSMEITLRAE